MTPLCITKKVEPSTLPGQLPMEEKIGSLEVGKLADILVLEGNQFHVDSMQIEEIEVAMTMMDGRPTSPTKATAR